MSLVILVVLAAMCSAEMLVKKELIEELKKTAKWKVTEYNKNIFKGMTDEDITNPTPTQFLSQRVEMDSFAMKAPKVNLKSETATCIHDIREQRSCVGGSFAFAVAGMVSDRCCLQKKKDYGWLSTMELLSCDKGNYGCAGGWPLWAANYTAMHGLVDEACYPYTGNNEDCPEKCKDKQDWKTARNCKCTNLKTLRSVDDVKAALAYGPVAVTFEAYDDFFLYKSGIYCHKGGSFKRLVSGRAIEILSDPEPHIRIAMSYGTSFGEAGYVRMCLTCCGLFNKYEKGNVACDVV